MSRNTTYIRAALKTMEPKERTVAHVLDCYYDLSPQGRQELEMWIDAVCAEMKRRSKTGQFGPMHALELLGRAMERGLM